MLSTTRRRWLQGVTAAPVAQARSAEPARAVYSTYFGDLHNHNDIGYAQGTIGRTFEIARSHLDFFAFTPHAYWPDIGTYPGNIENKWLNGFAVARARWPDVVELARRHDEPGKFVPILGYERHSTGEGDYHIVFPDLKGEYELIPKLREFQQFARSRKALLIPHHPSNRLGHRGTDIRLLDPSVSPVMEIYSEWGCAEHDRAPQPYKRHTEGGRWTRNTWQRYLEQGHRLGVIASSDDHLGFPGGYREGLAAVKATSLTREAIFDALRNRRTYAVTGDRIGLDFTLNGSLMGQSLPYARKRLLHVKVEGWDQVDRIELLKSNRVMHRDFPMDRVPGAGRWDRPTLVRFEYGWGPWPALGWGGTADWRFTIEVDGGRIEALQPCFTPGPLDERRRDRILRRDDRSVEVESFTALRQQVDDYSQKAIVLRISGGPESKIRVACEKPSRCEASQTLAQLAGSGEMLFTGPFPLESAMLHRLTFDENAGSSFTIEDEDPGHSLTWYYVRVVQSNGEMAWSSPIWVEKA
jgi:hypothetical protein